MPSLALACRLSAVSRASRRPFSPASLFANGEQGVWYDPSDLSTLFQDAYGTTPVTAVGQPVGLMLDKSKGLVLGPELVAQPINFNANWIATHGGAPVASGSSFTTSSLGGFWINKLTAGKTYQVTVTGTTTAASGVTLRQTDTTTASQIMTGFGSAVFTAQSGFTYFYVRNESAGTTTVTSISVREIPGNHALQSTTTSRPTLQQDTSGKYYLSFDGVDDYLSTGSIDFTTTDKMTVLAGVRKLRDSPIGTVVEASTNSETNDGAFFMTAPPDGGNTFLFGSRGTQLFYAYTPVGGVWAAPISVVQSGISEIASKVIMRLNGVLAAQQLVSQGSGKYGKYPLYIGRRGGTTNPFRGNLYGLIVRGAQTDDAHLTNTEKYLAYKTGVTL